MSTSNLTYTGDIRIRIYDKKNNLKFTKMYHNNGRWPLFNFISKCLIGNYDEANKYRPCYIGLFSIKKSVTTDGKIPTISERVFDNEKIEYEKTDIQYYLQNNTDSKLLTNYFNTYSYTSSSFKSNAVIGSSNVTFTFEIPSSYITLEKDEEKEWGYNYKPINLICLYSRGLKPTTISGNENLKEPLAYSFISKDEDPTLLGNLLNLDSEININTKYNIVIDWTLNFNNSLNNN